MVVVKVKMMAMMVGRLTMLTMMMIQVAINYVHEPLSKKVTQLQSNPSFELKYINSNKPRKYRKHVSVLRLFFFLKG